MENERTYEEILRAYFEAWVQKDSSVLGRVFCTDVYYSECWGPEYFGLDEVKRWFADWNARGTVLRWDISQFITQGSTVAAVWHFQNEYDGKTDAFDGVTVACFRDGKIKELREYGSKSGHTRPYHK